MSDISKYTKEYKDRENECKYCAYYKKLGGRCNQCECHSWFVQEISLKDYVIQRVIEDSETEFNNSTDCKELKREISRCESEYDDFEKYIEVQKEIKLRDLTNLKKIYENKWLAYRAKNLHEVLTALDSNI